MGAGQSSTAGNSGTETQSAPAVKTSYYELLSVERSATEDELKKAYRRKALELHPDRNYGNVESATKLFAEVQSAYEILSDPQERAWYDSHEAAILRGDDANDEAGGEGAQYEYNTRVTSADDLARLISKFNKNVEFSDAPSGFFGYLRETFEKLAQEEEIAANWENVDIPEYPCFGHRDDEYDDVVKGFYQVWNGFSTRKTFAWKDRFRLSEAPDRQYRRAMEKENKKFREEGVKEFNEAVRTLVMFVRKRDPRYTPNTQTEEQRQKILRDAAQAQAARARAANAAKMNQEVPAWAMHIEKDEHEGEISEEESEEEHYECVACKKTFKSEKQWGAHEKSKKHQKAVFQLRKQMQKDNAKLNLDRASGSGIDTHLSDEEVDQMPAEVDSDAETAEKLHHMSMQDEQDDSDDHVDRIEVREDSQAAAALAEQQEQVHSPDSDSESDSNDEYASAEAVKARLASSLGLDTPDATSTSTSSTPATTTAQDELKLESDGETTTPQSGKKLGAAAKKRLKKAAAAQAVASAIEESDSKFNCAGCGANFASKTKMHQHLKDNPKHAALKAVSGGGKKKGKK